MNKVELIGRITRDLEVRTGGNTSILNFNVAVQRDFKDKDGKYGADFINCVAFGKQAEFVSNYFKKGSQIALVGRIQTGSYTNKENKTIYTTDVAIEKAEFVGNKSENTGNTGNANEKKADDEFLSIPDTLDDVPFVNN